MLLYINNLRENITLEGERRMAEALFEQLNFVRQGTLNIVKELSEDQGNQIPPGFNNNILWNLGHIYYVQEIFAFHFAQEPMQLPKEYHKLFGVGTKPADWTIESPTLQKLIELLQEQPHRIKERLSNRLNEKVVNPFTLHDLTMNTFGELLSFNLFHEGNHAQTIKMYKKLNEK